MRTADDESLIAASEKDAARVTGFSRSQLRYWASKGIVEPSIVRQLSPRNVVRLYDFRGLLALLVVRELKEVPLSTYRIHRIVDRFKDAYNYVQPLTEMTFALGPGNEVHFKHPGGGWEGHKRPDQIVLEQTLHLEPLRAHLRQSVRRSGDEAGKIEKRRRVLRSKPVLAGTRVPPEAVETWVRRGFPDERILEAYPNLTVADIEAVRRSMSA